MKLYMTAGIVSLLLASSVRAEDDLWTNYRDMLTGQWIARGEIVEGAESEGIQVGDTFTMRSTYRAGLGGRILVAEQRLSLKRDPAAKFTSCLTCGWDPVKKCINIQVYWSNGDIEQATITGKEDNRMVGEYSGASITGATISGQAEVVIESPDKHVWRLTSGPQAGRVLSTWKRVVPKQSTEAPGAEATRAYMDFFTGEWKGTVRQGDESHECSWSIQRTPDEKGHMVLSSEDGAPSGQGLYGYDAGLKRWKGAVFNGNGGHVVIVLDRIPGDVAQGGHTWKSTNRGVTPDGTPVNQTAIWKIIDQNTIQLVISNQGDAADGPATVTFDMQRQ